MKTNLFLPAAIFILFFSCKNNTSQQQANTLLSGEITNPENTQIVCKTLHQTDTLNLNANNQFTFKLQLDKPEYITLFYGQKNTTLYLKPGKPVKISLNGNNIAQKVQVNGQNQAENQYLNQKLKLFLQHAIPPSQLYDRPVKAFRKLVDSIYVVEKIVLEDYIEKHPEISKAFIKYEQAALLYDRATKLLEYPRMSSYAQNINNNKYYGFIDKLDLNDESLLQVYEYRQFLDAYIELKMHQKVFVNGIQEVYPHEATLARLQVIIHCFTNTTIKNQMLFKVLNRHIKYYGYKNTDKLFQTFDNQCTNPDLKQKLMQPYKKYQELNQGAKAPDFSFTNLLGETYHFSDYQGSYLYVDVWATWCLPCRKEAPYFERMRAEYKNKNIVFISLSVDEKKQDWLDYINAKNKTTSQFWVPDYKQFLNLYMIKTIPHFLIISPDGNIMNANAPSPSSGNVQWIKDIDNKLPV